MKKFISGLLIGIMLMSSTTIFAETQMSINAIFGKVKLVVNNQVVEQETLVYNGTTYVPLRATAEILDKEVTYDNKTSTAYIDEKGTGRTNSSNTNSTQISDNKLKNDISLLNHALTLMETISKNEGLAIDYVNNENYGLASKYLTIAIDASAELKELDLSSVSSEIENALDKYAKSANKYLNNYNMAMYFLQNNDLTNASTQLDEGIKNQTEAGSYLNEYTRALEKYHKSISN